MTITDKIQDAINGIRVLQEYCHSEARARGFHEDGDALREQSLSTADEALGKVLTAAQAERAGNRLLLIVGEVIEAHEEIRAGRDLTETYHREDGKPEGVPSEVADILIRLLDFAGEYGIDLAAITEEKLAFNSTRPYKHGKNF